MFAGIGGFRFGLEQAGFKCVASCEIDKYARKAYKAIYGGNEPFYEDIRTVRSQHLQDFDILVGGFPCQAFSVAGKRGGFEDTRGTLFFELARIAKEKQPRLLLFENVKGLLSHDKGRTFGTILNTLDELGYDCEWQVLNSKDFGVPQNRERVYVVGHLRGRRTRKIFPLFGDMDCKNPSVTLTARGYGSQRNGTYVIKDSKIRTLTPLECWRLQGLPDWAFDKAVSAGVSDTQLYKQADNAVTVNVVRAVGIELMTMLKEVDSYRPR